MGITCSVIKDILPLYVDDVLSEDSRKLVEEHLSGCDNCKGVYESLKSGGGSEVNKANRDKEVIKKLRKKILTKRMIAVSIAVILVVVLFLGVYYGVFVRERYLSYEESGIYVENDMIKTARNYYSAHESLRIVDDGVIAFVYLSTTVHEDNMSQGETVDIEDFNKQDITLTKDGGNNVEKISVVKAYYVPEEYAKKMSNHYPSFASDKELQDIMDASVLIWERK